eukprot:TRINITY_DN430_c0_g2_i1.p1 TRINITY_DN430_c0_g2~~TRINITY_DN430_c0_g2_i1.p1  ORF type:complete len:1260 (+),score=393.84 TRINITY_DN430_c0_g2_i1:86-3781(+)
MALCEVLSDALYFPSGGAAVSTAVNCVILRSLCDEPLKFKVKLTHPEDMQGKPSKGVIPARGTAQCDVSLRSDKQLGGMDPPPRILIQCEPEAAGSQLPPWKQKLPCVFSEPPASGKRYHYQMGGETFRKDTPESETACLSPASLSPVSSPAHAAATRSDAFSLLVNLKALRSAAHDLRGRYSVVLRRGSIEQRTRADCPAAPDGASVAFQQVLELRGCAPASRKFLSVAVLQDGQEVGGLKLVANDPEQIGVGDHPPETDLPVKRPGGEAGWTLGLSLRAAPGATPVSPASAPAHPSGSISSSAAAPSPVCGVPASPTRRAWVAPVAPVTAVPVSSGEMMSANPLETDLTLAHPPKDQNIQVLVRIRPVLEKHQESGQVAWKWEPNKLIDEEREYDFDHVIYPDKNNLEVWGVVGPRFVDAVTEGLNGTIFMYGQTGSGKTHTMFGNAEGPEMAAEPGLTPLLFHHLFKRIHELTTATKSFAVEASYFEIYNEELNCLLGKGKNLKVREKREKAGGGSMFVVPDLKVERVTSMEECTRLLERGAANKKMGHSNINEKSSRSHTIFHLMVHCTTEGTGKKVTTVSNLNFCDLAGSETISEKGDGTQRKETGHINLSLTYLKKVISELAKAEEMGSKGKAQAQHIGYRNSMLTKILKQSLGGNARTTVIVTISPAREYHQQSKSTLQFGQLARTIKNRARVNVDNEETNLKEQVARLEQLLRRKTAEMEQLLQMQDDYMALRKEYDALVQENESLRRGESRERAMSTRLGMPPPAAADGSGAVAGAQGGEEGASGKFVEALNHQLNEKAREILDLKLQHRRELMDKTRQLHDALAAKEAAEENANQEETALELMQKDDRLDQLVFQILSYLHYGTRVTRVEGKGELHRRLLYLVTVDGQQHLCVCPLNPETGKGDKEKCLEKLPVRDIKKVVMGQYGQTWGRADAKLQPRFDQSFSVHSKKKRVQFDVACETESDFEAWIQSLNHLTGTPAEWGDPLKISDMQEVERLDPDEKSLCINMHIIPMDYLHAKSQVLNKEGRFITLFDVRTLSCLDLYHSQKLFAFFMSKGWIGQRKIFYLDTEAISRTANVYEVEYENDDDECGSGTGTPQPPAAAYPQATGSYPAQATTSYSAQYNPTPVSAASSYQHPPPGMYYQQPPGASYYAQQQLPPGAAAPGTYPPPQGPPQGVPKSSVPPGPPGAYGHAPPAGGYGAAPHPAYQGSPAAPRGAYAVG